MKKLFTTLLVVLIGIGSVLAAGEFGVIAGQSFTVNENAVNGTVIGTLQADGPPQFNPSGWRIEPEGALDKVFDVGAFDIDPDTGEIFVSDSTKLDYEQLTMHRLAFSVTDGSTRSSGMEVDIDVNNVADGDPVKTNSYLWGESGELWDPYGRLADWSTVGYRWGEEAIPDHNEWPVYDITSYGAVANDGLDDRAAIEAAVAAAPLSGAIIYMPAGKFEIRNVINITRGNIILRGAGRGAGGTELHCPVSQEDVFGAGFAPLDKFINFKGSLTEFNHRTVAAEAKRGDRTLLLDTAPPSSWESGKKVFLSLDEEGVDQLGPMWEHFHNCQAAKPDPGLLESWVTASGEWPFTIDRIDGNLVTFKEALHFDVRLAWQPQLFECVPISEVGVEDFKMTFPYIPQPVHLMEPGYNGFDFEMVEHGWMRRLEFVNADSPMSLTRSSNCTISDIIYSGRAGHHAGSFGRGGHNLARGLVYNTSGSYYYHGFTVIHRTAGNVICDASGSAQFQVDNHGNSPMENLWANITTPWGDGGGGIAGSMPHSAHGATFWNITGPQYSLLKSNYKYVGRNVIGPSTMSSDSHTMSREWHETTTSLSPLNLYDAQLDRRLNYTDPVFTTGPFGDRSNWFERDPTRWYVSSDPAYTLRFGEAPAVATNRLSEYSVFNSSFMNGIEMSVKSLEDLTRNPDADLALVLGYQDDENYIYASVHATNGAEVVRVQNGTGSVLASNPAILLVADAWKTMSLTRSGTTVELSYNGQTLQATDSVFTSGKIGIGSTLGTAAFKSVGGDTTSPATPTGLSATDGSGIVDLDWADNSEPDLVGYTVYRSTTSGSGYAAIATVLDASAYSDTTVVNGTTYYYVVTAVDSSGNESANSAEVSASPVADTTPPAAPTGLSATAGDSVVDLNWADNSEPDLASYTVYRSTTSGSGYVAIATGVSASAYSDSTAVNDTTYYYVVTATDTSENNSANSAEVSAMPYENIVSNPGFESGTTGWAGFGCSVSAVSTPTPHSGTYCGAGTARQGTWAGPKYDLMGKMVAGHTYQISAWLRVGVASDAVKIQMRKDGAGAAIASGTANNTGWVQLTAEYTLTTAPATELFVYFTGPATGVDIYVDDVVIYDMTAPAAAPTGLVATAGDGVVDLDWADNGEPDLASYTVYRSTTSGSGYAAIATGVSASDYSDTSAINIGAPYYYVVTAVDTLANESANSAEVSATPESVANIVSNPGFEAGTTGWAGFGCSVSAVSTPTPYAGTYCLAGTGRSGTWAGPKQDLMGKMVTGHTYQISAWLRVGVASDAVKIQMRKDGVGAAIASGTANNTDWVQLTAEYTLTSTPTNELFVYFTGPATGVDIYVDDVVIYDMTAPPLSPTGLGATAGVNVVNLDWADNTEPDLGSYTVYRSTTSGSGYAAIATGVSASDYSDTNAVGGTTYYYQVTAVDTLANESANSAEVSATAEEPDTTPPAAPTGLGATTGVNVVNLDWADNSEPDLGSYTVYRSTTSGSGYAAIATGLSVSDYSDSTAVGGTTYYYVVTAVDTNANESANSAEVSATPDVPDTTPPAAPTGLVSMINNSLVGLDWADNSEPDLGSYTVYRSTTSGSGYAAIATGLSVSDYSDTNVVNDTTYYYVVSAVDTNANESANSAEISATPASIVNMLDNPDFETGTTAGWSAFGGGSSIEVVTSPVYEGTYSGRSTGRTATYNGISQGLMGKMTDGHSYTVSAWVRVSSASDTVMFSLKKTDGSGTSYPTVGSVTASSNGWTLITGTYDLNVTGTLTELFMYFQGPAVGVDIYVDDVVVYDTTPPDTTPPAAPTGLGATAGDGVVNLDWADNSEPDLASYTVYRSTTSGSGYVAIATGVSASDYSDNTVVNDTTYYYVVTAVDTSVNESANSAEVSATPIVETTPPAAPTGLGATAGDNVVNLDWADNTEPDLGSYTVYRSTTSGSGYAAVATGVSASDYSDTNAVGGTTYYYVVTAVDTNANESANSAEVSATPTVPDTTPPAAPTALSALAGIGLVDLDWADNSEPDLGSYSVYRSTTSGSGYAAIATALSASDYSDTTAVNGTTYYYVVTAVDTNANESAYSAEVSAQPGMVADFAGSDVAVQGTVSGALADSTTNDDTYQSITEVIDGSTSALEHKWIFNVTGAELVTFYVEAHHSVNGEGDDFIFAYSTNDVDYVDMVTVTKTADDNTAQFYSLPSGLSGTVYVRVKDADRTGGNTQLDTVNVDALFIVSEESTVAPAVASAPVPADGATNVSVSAQLSWTAGSMSVSHDVYFGTSPSPAFQGNQSGTQFDPGALLNSTTYYWAVDEVNNSGTTAGPVWSFTTVAAPNNPPAFTADPIVEANGEENVAYSGTIADDASDPESDPMTFSKVSGPAWLSVASDGTLSGTPTSGDVGLNSFTVQVDAQGGSDTATLEITVTAAPALPAAPSSLSATAVTTTRIDLSWTDNADNETGFKIERSDRNNSSFSQIATVGENVTAFNDTTVRKGTTYYYRVRATNADGDSAYSNEANATTPK